METRPPVKDWLIGKWFLIALVLVVSIAFALTSAVGSVTRHVPFQPVVVVIMFLMALSLRGSHLADALRRPAPVLIAVAVGYTVLPGLAWALGRLLLPAAPRDLAVGLIVAGSVPCTLASATIWTRLAGGNDAVALMTTMVSNCTGFLATTLLLSLLTGRDVQLDVGEMMWHLVVIIVLPVAAGQLARRLPVIDRSADRAKSAMGVASRLLILAIVLKGAVEAASRLHAPDVYLSHVALAALVTACVVVHVLAMAAAAGVCRLARIARADAIAAAFGASQKTLPVGLYIIATFYPGYGLAVLPMLLYHVLQLTVDSFIADRLNAKGRIAGELAPYS